MFFCWSHLVLRYSNSEVRRYTRTKVKKIMYERIMYHVLRIIHKIKSNGNLMSTVKKDINTSSYLIIYGLLSGSTEIENVDTNLRMFDIEGLKCTNKLYSRKIRLYLNLDSLIESIRYMNDVISVFCVWTLMSKGRR